MFYPTKVLQFIPDEKYLDIPDLLEQLILKKCIVLPYPIYEMWTDVGTVHDLNKLGEFDWWE